MALKAPTGSSSTSKFTYEVLEPDTYPARVAQVIDLGLQPQPAYDGKAKDPRHTISITYELLDAFMKDENGEEIPDKPRWISEKFPLYSLTSDRAKSTQRYNAIDPRGNFEGDFAALVGSPCSVLVGQFRKKDGTMGNGVNGVSPIMRGMTIPELAQEGKVFSLDDPDMTVFEGFPDWLKGVITTNLNFKGSALERRINGEAGLQKAEKKAEPKAETKTEQAPAKDETPIDEDTPW